MRETETLEQCLEIGKTAYEQEMNRQKQIADKADYLMKYHTLLIAVLNLSVPLILKYTDANKLNSWRVLYILTMAGLLLGIISTMLIQIPRRTAMFQLGSTILKKIQKEGGEVAQDKWLYDKVLSYDRSTISLEKANDKAIKWIVMSYVFLAAGVLLLGLFFYIVIT